MGSEGDRPCGARAAGERLSADMVSAEGHPVLPVEQQGTGRNDCVDFHEISEISCDLFDLVSVYMDNRIKK